MQISNDKAQNQKLVQLLHNKYNRQISANLNELDEIFLSDP